MSFKKISFCTVAMDRAHHVEATLGKNIEDSLNYPSLEFIIMDYNSTDDLETIIRRNFSAYIKQGLLSYYKTFDPVYFHRSHSRNMAFRLATGDILCNVDADNYLGKDFAFFVNEKFSDNCAKFLSAGGTNKNVFGRLCILKETFEYVLGYDEAMSDYGFEDFDIINRLTLLGLKREFILDEKFLGAIEHDDYERVKNETYCKNLSSILVNYINYFSSQLMFLFEDKTFSMGTIIDNFSKAASSKYNELSESKIEYEFSLKEKQWQEGKWRNEDGKIEFYSEFFYKSLTIEDSFYTDGNQIFYKIDKNSNLAEEGIFFFSQIKNRSKMYENVKNCAVVTNAEFGRGVVYKNFDFKNPIELK